MLYPIVALVALATAMPAWAHCDRDVIELLNFAVTNASTNFAAIKGERDGAGSTHLSLSPAAEKFCPNVFILRDVTENGGHSGYWDMKFDESHDGNEDEVAIWVIKQFSAALKRQGFQDKPFVNEGNVGTYKLEWDGPSDVWVIAETFEDKPGHFLYEVRVGHNVH
jgi:hypothetical protein